MFFILQSGWVVLPLIAESVVAFLIGYLYRKKFAEKKIKNAEEEALKILENAREVIENEKKIMLLEAKEDMFKERKELDDEIKERRNSLQKQERRLQQKIESLDKKYDSVEEKETQVAEKYKNVETLQNEMEKIRQFQLTQLEEISHLSAAEAKDHLLILIRDEVKHESAIIVRNIELQTKEEADSKAKEIIVGAIQRCAVEHAADVTVSVVPLPSDDTKGRIIGREGRNIRTLETLTGVDFIVDDTPEAVIISGFDPMRREVARMTLEKLILDGRIHPAKIEEAFEKCSKDMKAMIKKEGELASFEAEVNGLPLEVIKLLGRLKYRTSYGQNVLKHSVEVARVAGLMAAELGENEALTRRAGLLHDIGKALDHEVEGSHVNIGVELAKRYKESEEVVHAIAAHHGDIEVLSVIAVLIQAADAISAARPGARRENVEKYFKRLKKLEAIANSFEGVERAFAIQAGREIRIMVKPDNVNDSDTILMARDIVKKIQTELEYPGQIKVNVIRELRAVEYAK